MPYIFVSYSHEDKEYAHRLEEALKLKGFEVWLDDRIDYGTQWPEEIEEKHIQRKSFFRGTRWKPRPHSLDDAGI